MKSDIIVCQFSTDLDSLPGILQKKYALLRDLDKSLQGMSLSGSNDNIIVIVMISSL